LGDGQDSKTTKSTKLIFESKITYTASGTETAVVINQVQLSPTKIGSSYLDGAKLMISRDSFKVPPIEITKEDDLKFFKEQNMYPSQVDQRFIKKGQESAPVIREELKYIFSEW
jgi:hypothetical protein